MKKIYLYGLLFVVGAWFGTFAYVRAAPPVGTSVGGELSGDIRWTLDKSPYLLTQDIYVRTGSRLTIDPGVIVDIDPKTVNEPNINIEAGSLVIGGVAGAHVVIRERVGEINILGASSSIMYLDIRDSDIYALKSSVTISSSTLTNTHGPALMLWDGKADVRASSIENSVSGIIIASDFDGLHSSLTIEHSSIAGNSTYAINNKGTMAVHAENNWWGSADGPATSSMYGSVSYSPWLNTKPKSESLKECCSSILFIPGLEASSLYKSDASVFGSHTNTLWAPNRNDDVRALFLDVDGKSIDPSIYTGGPIGSIFGIYSLYGKFMSFLDELMSSGAINEWYGFGYDWRKPIVEVVNGFAQKATTTESLIKLVEDMSLRSQTGKVTIVAHSNGGLVSKYLVKALADKGEANLIDSVISVAVPYLGTPQAIAGLLYGDNQQVAGGFIVKKSVAQELGKNMPSAYSLLPSKKYISLIGNPIIGTTSAMYPNRSLLASADSLHDMLDSFSWPATIQRWALVGWHTFTTKIVSYVDDKQSKIRTTMGDGTVVAQSASYDAGTTTSIDLQNIGSKGTDHATILESPASQKIIKNIVQHNDSANASIPGVAVGVPDYSKETTSLQLMTHSPVELHVYDKEGRHVGVKPKPASVPTDVEDGLYTFFDTDIPGSSFDISDESDSGRDTSITIPDDGSGPYSVVIKGAGVGPFNFDIYRQGGSGTIERVAYTDVPATPLTNATMSLDIAPLGSSATSSLTYDSPMLVVDTDGNGASDLHVAANTPTDPVVFLESMKKAVLYLLDPVQKGKDISKSIIRKIDQLEDAARSGKISRLHDTASRFSVHLAHRSIKGMSDDDRMAIVNMIDEFLTHLASSQIL